MEKVVATIFAVVVVAAAAFPAVYTTLALA